MLSRHVCSSCQKKQYEKFMFKVRYVAIARTVFLCSSCYNCYVDKIVVVPPLSSCEDKY